MPTTRCWWASARTPCSTAASRLSEGGWTDMPTYLVELATPVPASHSAQLAQRVYYLAPDIDSFALVWRGDRVTGVEIATVGETDHAELARKLEYVAGTEVLPQRLFTPQRIWQSPHAAKLSDGVFTELQALGVVHEMGPGAIATAPPFTTVLGALDARIRGLAVDQFGGVEVRYPTLVSTSSLRRGGYLRSFPQLVMSASQLRVDLDVYQHFVSDLAAAGEPGPVLDRHSVHSGYCLPPTMCFHTYHQLSGRSLPDTSCVVTSRGKSFRFESGYRCSLERLWDFTIREIVFICEAATVARQRADFLSASCALADEWGLAGQVESADDPFFADASVPERVLAQRLRKLKYELRIPAEQGRTISVASFNVHGTTFGEPYRIRLPNGEVAHTACVGFGLERLTFAMF